MTLRSILAATSTSLTHRRWLKSTARTALERLAPSLLTRLRGLSSEATSLTRLGTTWTPRDAFALTDLHPVLADPDLATLERPDSLSADYVQRLASPGNDVLEPVLELGQMRQSVTTVCFVVPIVTGDATLLERTMQSVLRQTDPGWEVLLCCGEHPLFCRFADLNSI